MTQLDPFTQAANAIDTIVRAHAGVAALFGGGNILNTKRRKIKTHVQPGDLPEMLVVEPAGFNFQPFRTNTTAVCRARYLIKVATGSYDEEIGLYPIRWALMRALGSRDDNLGLSFVTQITLDDGNDQSANEEEQRGVSQWVTAIGVTLDMQFSRANDLKAATPQLQGSP